MDRERDRDWCDVGRSHNLLAGTRIFLKSSLHEKKTSPNVIESVPSRTCTILQYCRLSLKIFP